MNVKNVVAINSGTSALFAAAVAADVRTGDEVLLPSFTFVATANSVIAAGAKPIFVDVNKHDYTIDVSDLKAKITKKTRAIVPVHCADILQIWTRLPRWPRDNQLVLLRMHANHSGQRTIINKQELLVLWVALAFMLAKS